MIFYEDADKTLERADDRTVQHDRMPARVVFSHILGAQPLRHVEVNLHGAALPGAPQRVLQRVLNLRAVESTVSGRDHKVDA